MISGPSRATRILIVDDERDFRSSMSMLLSLVGFEVDEAADGHEALRRLAGNQAERHPDVILLDYRMPGLDGGQVLAELRARGIRTCVVLVSAVGDLRVVAERHAFDAAVSKPCDLEELVSVIRRCTASPRA